MQEKGSSVLFNLHLMNIEDQIFAHNGMRASIFSTAVAERLRRACPAPPERAGVGSISANPDAQKVPS
jgi:hypothetical protein